VPAASSRSRHKALPLRFLDWATRSKEPSMATTTALSRSLNDRMIAGVVGGIARRFGWSSTLLRVLFVIVSIASAAFPGILVYLILWLLIPNQAD
jgi:phage shock protein PspC (stress-responsive transcriptional regulator)